MKLRRRRQSEVPPKIKSFINGVIAVPLENIEEPLKSFFWDFDKGDFHHWVDLFNHFDTFFEKYIKPRKDLQLDDGFLESDPPFPREAVLQILRVVRTILDNCTNKHFYSSYEHHLSSLLASTDADVVEACLQTLSSFLRKSIGKHIARDTSLSSKLFAFAQGWGGKDEGLGLVACALENVSDPVAHELGSTLHFEFYDNSAAEKSTQGLQIIHLPNINTYEKPDLELLHELIEEYKVPSGLRFSLLARLRFSRAFSSFTARQQYTCIRLHAFIVLVQACGDSDDLVSFFNTEPEFINELVALLSYEDAVPEKIRILSLYSLAALSQDRSRQPTVLTAVTSGGHRGILSSLMQKAIDTVVSKSSKSSVLFAEALLSLVTVLVSSSSGCSAMREAGFIPTLLPLLKDTDSQHLHLVSTAVHVLEAFMDYSNPAAALFRDLGGLDDTISRLKIEVSHVENGTSVQIDSSSSSSEPLYSEAMVSYHRRSLMKALLRAISLGTYAPGTTARVYGSEESLLPQCLHVIFKKAKDFGGGMFSLAAVVMSDLIHKDPTCYSILEQAALPSAFLDAIMDGVLCSAEAITCIPQCLDALCLSNNGLQAVKDRNALRCFVKIFTSRNYLRALMGDTPSSLSSGLDELIPEGVENGSGNEIAATDDAEQHHEGTNQDEGDHDHESNLNESADPELRIEMDEMEDGGVLRDSDQIEMTFHVESRGGGDNTGDEDDEMGDDGEDEEDDDDGDDEDEDIAEDGTALMSLADTDVEDHDETGLGDEYNDEMVDDEDDDYHENRVIEVRWREALDGVLGQPGAESGLIDIAAEPFEGVNVDDLFGLRRPIGFDRRRQQSRTSFERTGTDGNNHNSLQHPLLLRPPSQSGELGPMWSSGGGNGNSSRDLESLSGGSFDVSHFYMFDAPVLPFDPVQSVQSTVFGDRSGGGAPPLADFSVGLESLRAPTRRGPGDGRWTDDGQPQAGGQAAAIAQAVEEHFMSQLNTTTSLANDNQPVADAVNNDAQQTEVPHEENDQNVNQVAENVEQTPEGQASGPSPDATNNTPDSHDNMEIGEANVNEQQELSTPDEEASNNTRTSGELNADVDMNNAAGGDLLPPVGVTEDSLSEQNTHIEDGQTGQTSQADDIGATNIAQSTNGIDPTFLEALPAELRAEVLASQQAQSVPPPVSAPAPTPATAEEIDPEFLAALPPDIQAEVLAQQRAQRVAHQAEGQPVDMDNASIIATFPADLREEVLLTSSEAVLSALPSPLLAEAQMLRDRAMSHYQARSLFGNSHRLNNRRNGLGFDRQTVIDRGVGVTVGRRASSALLESLKVKEVEGDPLLDPDALKALIRLLRLAQPLGKGLLQRLFLNLCAHSYTRAVLVFLLLGMIKIETEGPSGGLTTVNSQRLYGCQSNVVYGRSQLLDGLPPLVLRRVLEILTYLATNHSSVASLLFHFDSSLVPESLNVTYHDKKNDKGKEKVVEEREISHPVGSDGDIPILLLVKLLNQPLFLRSIAHLEQVMGLLQVVVYNAASKLESQSTTEQEQAVASSQGPPGDESASNPQHDSSSAGAEPNHDDTAVKDGLSTSDGQKHVNMFDIFMKLPHSDLQNLCSLLGHEGLSDKVYLLAGEVLKKLASVAPSHRKFFITELSDLAHSLSGSAIRELVTLRNTHMLGLSAGSMAGAAVLRILQTLSSLTLPDTDVGNSKNDDNQEHVTMWKLNHSLEPLWQELSECISVTETQLAQGSFSSVISDSSSGEHAPGAGAASLSSLPPGTQRLLPFIESFLVLCEKLQANNTNLQQDDAYATAREGKEVSGSSSPSGTGIDGAVTFAKFAEKHRRLLNAFVRQNPGLLEKSLSMMLKAPRLIDFDNKRLYFRSRIRQQHDQHLTGPLRISVRRAYVLEDSYNQLRMRPTQELKGRLNVHFQGEEGIDAGGLTREWYQLLSRVIFDKGALLFTTGGNNATFQPNPNSVYQTEHLSYFKFVGRVVAKALFDGQLLDVYFTRSFYKHILGVKVTYHDIEAVDPDYYKNLKWLLENDVSDILDLTFSMDADEEKHILYEKTEVTDYELKPGGRNIRVTEETKHEYVDLVAEHILTNAIRPQINSFLEGFNELIPRELISIFNDKELELLISGLPEIDLDDLKANTEYTGYTIGSSVVTWFWEVVNAFNKEDRARLLQFVTGTSKVPLEGFKALQGISGPQRFQIHKAYGAPERLPSAHTCFNQLDLPEYTSKEQLQERLLLAIHEASEGFGFG
ncbi:putative HECT domain, armadillo-like helical, HECT, E3 ligase catalytic domain-containing protein [Helianthus annuus]|nr:putative HECT domain, armadillo-like helical, HECT, E3 ligase catalytic domain-containing protein [Helianthus annuus]KAJ0498203.1 putative HECT domain, armadillo-like helical, HECT, E3 ligase catalytic domain-containing protein [Helianthus annuus]KAJ0664207.1 putative HECT domain, armadillo-like helical, HECT, E3 ligase catalytic domain-containing protein [Helianthus annuus]KAJ0671686.1 putative HECT domain, armadillo-like helical, HECT, E3 ligase catalytic domain-containing protein [Helianth